MIFSFAYYIFASFQVSPCSTPFNNSSVLLILALAVFLKTSVFFLLLHAFIYSSSNKSQQCVVTFSQFYPIQSVGILRKKKSFTIAVKKKNKFRQTIHVSRVSHWASENFSLSWFWRVPKKKEKNLKNVIIISAKCR